MKHTLKIPNWRPTPLNQLLGHWARAHKRKRYDRDVVYCHAMNQHIPTAVGKRRVSLLVTLGPRVRACDPDSYWKTILDGLVCAGLLVDDRRQMCELGGIEFDRGEENGVVVVLEDVE